MCDTEDGEFVIWSFWEDGYKSFPNAGECFAHLKKAYLEMKMFPVSKEEMRELREGNQRDKEITRLAKEHGWPSEGFQWHKFLAAAKAAGLPGFRV